MTNKQIITIAPDGTMSGLQRKKGEGLDLRQFGDAKIERASEIRWDETRQLWFIQMLTGPRAGEAVTPEHWAAACSGPLPETTVAAASQQAGYLLFVDYDEAVRVEIAVLDGFRVRGLF